MISRRKPNNSEDSLLQDHFNPHDSQILYQFILTFSSMVFQQNHESRLYNECFLSIFIDHHESTVYI
jgi:hypothetical protein